MSDSHATVEEWLATSSFLLELEVARAFAQSEFTVHQGVHYGDKGTSKRREIDVLAVREEVRSSPRPTRVSCVWVVECKRTGAPWVVLQSDRRGGRLEGIDSLVSHPLTPEHVFDALPEDADPWIARLPARVGFRVVEAERRSQADHPYEAFAQAISAARGVVEGATSVIPTVVMPLVVISGDLYTVHHGGEGETRVESVSWQRIEWASSPWGGAAVVDVVTRNGLHDYVGEARAGADEILPTLRSAWLNNRASILEQEHERREPPRAGRRWLDRLLDPF